MSPRTVSPVTSAFRVNRLIIRAPDSSKVLGKDADLRGREHPEGGQEGRPCPSLRRTRLKSLVGRQGWEARSKRGPVGRLCEKSPPSGPDPGTCVDRQEEGLTKP